MVFGKQELHECSNCLFVKSHLQCMECSRVYRDRFQPKSKLPDALCMCVECKKFYDMTTIDKLFIYPLEDEPTRGICFECY